MLIDKINKSIDIIKQNVPKADGCDLGFSGGKDSICIEKLAEMSGVKYRPIYNITTVDPPELVKFIKTFYPVVKFIRPEYSMFQLIAYKEKFLPLSNKKYCCRYLKHNYKGSKIIILGIRKQESKNRKDRKFIEKFNERLQINPILDWSSKDVWTFIRKQKLIYPELYDCGFNRLGCVGCPCAYYKTRQKQFNLFPKIKNIYIKAIRVLIQDHNKYSDFDDEYDVFNWWISGTSKAIYFSNKKQLKLF